jgi:hypothetical protein
LADANQVEAIGKPGETDVVRGDAQSGCAKPALAFFDRLPAFLKRRQVPPFASAADRPKPAPLSVEC